MHSPPPGRRAPARTIEVVAHRGSSEDVAEHTLAAYAKAVADGADALECDVRLTRDGHLVCVHDRRVERTSNGRGPVSTLELAQLDELDFGSWKTREVWSDLEDPEEPDTDHRRILTLDRLFRLVADSRPGLQIAVETKHPTRYAGLVERRLVELMQHFGWARPAMGQTVPVRVMSFSPLSLRRMRALAPGTRTVLLLDRLPLRLRDGMLPPTTRIAGPSIESLRLFPEYVERVQRRGFSVHVWTVDRDADIDLCIRLGVDAIITNRPRHVLDALGR